jgi:hypothetical protein
VLCVFVASAYVFCGHCENLTSMNIVYKKVNWSHYGPGVAQGVPGS